MEQVFHIFSTKRGMPLPLCHLQPGTSQCQQCQGSGAARRRLPACQSESGAGARGGRGGPCQPGCRSSPSQRGQRQRRRARGGRESLPSLPLDRLQPVQRHLQQPGYGSLCFFVCLCWMDGWKHKNPLQTVLTLAV